MAQSDRIAQRRIAFAQGFEINGDTERRAGFVLPPIAPPDRAGLVVENIHVRPEKRLHFARLLHQRGLVLQERKDAGLDRRHARMKTEHNARFALPFFIRDRFLVVGLADQRQDRAIDPRARLDHVRDETRLVSSSK